MNYLNFWMVWRHWRMKWPEYLAIVRHGESKFNKLKRELEKDPLWQEFLREYKKSLRSSETMALADALLEKYKLGHSDYDTPLTETGFEQAEKTGLFLKSKIAPPDIVIVSPYLRCRQTFKGLKRGWPELRHIPWYTDELLVERSVGIRAIYLHWRIFYAKHPEQKAFYDSWGKTAYYHYRFPQGDSAPDTRLHVRLLDYTLTREFPRKKVLLVAHHQTILAERAHRERMTPEQFLELDHNNPPKNCSITVYRGRPELGKNGKLILDCYNETAP